MPKQVVVIGLGRFGASVARELYQLGHDVMAIDSDERTVQEHMGQVTYSVTTDATSEPALRELGIPNFEMAIVGIGSDVQSSLMSTVLLKTMGIPYIVARANNDLHGRTLERIGADRVVYPEQENGIRLAHSLFQSGVIEYMEVTSNYGINKLRPPAHMVGQSLEEAGLSGTRDKYGSAVLAIRRGREPILAPAKDEEIQPGDILIVAGTEETLAKFRPN